MTTEAQTNSTQQEPKTEAPPKDAGITAKPEVAPKTEVQTKTEAAPKVETQLEGEAKTPKRLTMKDSDEEIPDDVELIELSSRALKGRLDRHTKKQLKERFGTDDFAVIKAKLDRVTELEEKEEKQRRDALTKEQKLEEDLKKERSARALAEQRVNAIYNERVFEREENRVNKIAEKFIDPDYVEAHLPAFAKFLNKKYTKEELEKLKDSDLEGWWKELAEKKPKFAREEQPAAKTKPKTPHSNSPKEGDKPAAKTPGGAGGGGDPAQGGKTYAPNRPNSMTGPEARAAARKEGYQW